MTTTAASMATITSSISTALGTVKADSLEVIAVVVPIAIALAGVIWVSKRAFGWFSNIASKR